jgi:hypothetical protein
MATCVKCGETADERNTICLDCGIDDAGARAMLGALKRYTVTPWYGENRNVFYVMRNDQCNPADWEVVASFPDRQSAADDARARS